MRIGRSRLKVGVLFVVLITACVFLFISTPFVYMGANLVRDWYRESMLSMPCLEVFHFTVAKNGGILIRSWLCTETTSTYSEVATWYTQRGWICDGACEGDFRTIDLGPLHIRNTWNLMKPVGNDFQRSPLQIVLYEEYYIFVH